MPANMLTMAFVLGVLANPGGVVESKSGIRGRKSAGVPAADPAGIGTLDRLQALPTLPGEYFDRKARAIISDSKYMASEQVATLGGDCPTRLAWDSGIPIFTSRRDGPDGAGDASDRPAVQKEWSAKAIASYEKSGAIGAPRSPFRIGLAWSLDASQRFAESEPLFKRAWNWSRIPGMPLWLRFPSACAGKARRSCREYQRRSSYTWTVGADGAGSCEAELKGGAAERKSCSLLPCLEQPADLFDQVFLIERTLHATPVEKDGRTPSRPPLSASSVAGLHALSGLGDFRHSAKRPWSRWSAAARDDNFASLKSPPSSKSLS